MTCICTSMDMTSRYPAEFERPLSGNWRRTFSLLLRRSFLRPQYHSLWSSICHRDDMVNVSLHERLPLEISDQEINLRRALRASVGTLKLQPYAAIKLFLSCVEEHQALRGALRVDRGTGKPRQSWASTRDEKLPGENVPAFDTSRPAS